MEDFDLLLGIVDLAGPELRGRTTLQKLAYFATALKVGGFEFNPHYYGPYSREVASTADLLVGFELLNERAESLGERPDPWLQEIGGDMKAFTYSLTPEGKKFTAESKEKNAEEWLRLRDIVEACRQAAGLSPSILASAAKIHFLVSSGSIAHVTAQTVEEAAPKFGWHLSEADVRRTEDLLKRLGFAWS